jgi:hypothetical protein
VKLFAIAFIPCVLLAPVARAANDFSVSFSEKELKLKNPTDPSWEAWFEGDIGYQRMIERNQPFIELTNDAGSLDPINEFHITIGDNRFNFAPVDGSSAVKLSRTTPGFNISGSPINGDELVVNIGNGGLLPGQTVRFKIKLGIDPSFAAAYAASFDSSVPDYRTVLFDMNGVNVYDGFTTNKSSDDNSQMFVNFNPGGKSLVEILPDADVEESQFFNDRIRGGCCCIGDPVLIFTPEPIPEPNSIALAIFGVVGLLAGRRRRMAA